MCRVLLVVYTTLVHVWCERQGSGGWSCRGRRGVAPASWTCIQRQSRDRPLRQLLFTLQYSSVVIASVTSILSFTYHRSIRTVSLPNTCHSAAPPTADISLQDSPDWLKSSSGNVRFRKRAPGLGFQRKGKEFPNKGLVQELSRVKTKPGSGEFLAFLLRVLGLGWHGVSATATNPARCP